VQKIRRILVPIRDLQARQSSAIRKAAQLAQTWGAEIELFHAIATPVPLELSSAPNYNIQKVKADSRNASLATLERLATPLRRLGIKVSTAALWDYPTFEAIVRRALASNAGLIVTQSHDRHRLAGLLGYTDWELLRLCPMPVLLVKTPRTYRRPTILAAVDPKHSHAKSGELDKRILQIAAEFTLALRGSLRVVHAYVPEPQAPPPGLLLNNIIPTRAFKAAEREARSVFESALVKKAAPPSRRHLVAGSPSAAIAATARKTHSAMVVLGSVSRSGLKRLFIGNTAEKVLDDLRCDVLIVKPSRFPVKVARARRGAQFFPVTVPWGA
jgi:universal stress protein E